jgi:hypothetical protein
VSGRLLSLSYERLHVLMNDQRHSCHIVRGFIECYHSCYLIRYLQAARSGHVCTCRPSVPHSFSNSVSLTPTVFLPLSFLSYASILGIASTVLLIGVIFVDGFSKFDAPGSLWSPAETSFSFCNLGELGLAFGLFMAGVCIFSPLITSCMISKSIHSSAPTQPSHL